MKDVMNLLFFGQFELISLFAYCVKYSKRSKKLGFQLAILLTLEVLTTQLDFVAWGIALALNLFIMGLLLKFLSMVKILLVNGHEVLKLKK